ncbi:hypothetical protein IQ266_22075 [filamentous cyanobacterium LEGE 11480]|uniref:Uncharacterized protein n=1 Tax=Romeriopsis navalis LEGE 11480 TaxID=2777977 RepID=A0A928VUF0_9CYAN|nr:hypothetical protein [Romeriopsis navalis]MBE9032429.1 hypothetical protein [Romeriopsis navalis LEGE 11480]
MNWLINERVFQEIHLLYRQLFIGYMGLSAITIGFLSFIIVYLVRRERRTRQVVQWWQQRQSEWRYAESERLRDSTLQLLFSLRRQLELMQLQSVEPENELLETVEQCQQDLNQLSDRLFSAYTSDCLLSAIRELCEEIEGYFPHITFKIQGEGEFKSPTQVDSHFLLIWLRELLQVLLDNDGVESVVIQLITSSVQQVQIVVKAECCDEAVCSKLHDLATLNYLCQTFTVLARGRCHAQVQGNALNYSLLWPPQANLLLTSTPFLGTNHDPVSDFSR